MKRALILHGKDGHGHAHWFPWLKAQLEARGYDVWVPDLPRSSEPDARRWTEFLLEHRDWDFNGAIAIGHSAGAVEILQLARALPSGERLKAGILCGSFSHVLPEDPSWAALNGLFHPSLDFSAIRQKVEHLVFVHAKDDPWCPLDQAEYLARETGGDLAVLETGRHFTTTLDPEFKQFPQLMNILEQRTLL